MFLQVVGILLKVNNTILFFLAITWRFSIRSFGVQLLSTLPCSARRAPSRKPRPMTPSMKFRTSLPNTTCSMMNMWVGPNLLPPAPLYVFFLTTHLLRDGKCSWKHFTCATFCLCVFVSPGWRHLLLHNNSWPLFIFYLCKVFKKIKAVSKVYSR